MEYPNKIVDFHKYCPTCSYRYYHEDQHPCDECMMYPANEHSHKPVMYKECKEEK